MARHMHRVVYPSNSTMRSNQTLLLAFALVALLPGALFAQRGALNADCIIQLKGAKGGQTRLTVMPGTSPAYVITPTNLHFVLDLTLDETYLLTFEHPDCVTKELYLDATVPVDMRTRDFDFPLMVVLEHHEEPFTYAGPVGFIYYDHSITDFSYHTEYGITVNTRFGERMAELQRTGVDPRSAILGYTASTTAASPVSVAPKEEEIPLPTWSTLAPTVAHVGPMVHRLNRGDDAAQATTLSETPSTATRSRAAVSTRMQPRTPLTADITKAAQRPAPATANIGMLAGMEQLVDRNDDVPEHTVASWELIVEDQRLTTIIRCADQDDNSTEYRRVLHSSGTAYYFQDGRSISAHSYGKATAHLRESFTEAAPGTPDLLQ